MKELFEFHYRRVAVAPCNNNGTTTKHMTGTNQLSPITNSTKTSFIHKSAELSSKSLQIPQVTKGLTITNPICCKAADHSLFRTLAKESGINKSKERKIANPIFKVDATAINIPDSIKLKDLIMEERGALEGIAVGEGESRRERKTGVNANTVNTVCRIDCYE